MTVKDAIGGSSKTFENLATTLASFVTLAFFQLALRRLARK